MELGTIEQTEVPNFSELDEGEGSDLPQLPEEDKLPDDKPIMTLRLQFAFEGEPESAWMQVHALMQSAKAKGLTFIEGRVVDAYLDPEPDEF